VKHSILEQIEGVRLEDLKEEYRHWVSSVAILIDSLFSSEREDQFLDFTSGHLSSAELIPEPILIAEDGIERLVSELDTVYEYSVEGVARIDGELASLTHIKPVLRRFMTIGRLSWKTSNYFDSYAARREELSERSTGLDVFSDLYETYHAGVEAVEGELFEFAKDLGIEKDMVLEYDPDRIAEFRWKALEQSRNLEESHLSSNKGWDRNVCALIGKHVSARYKMDFLGFISLEEVSLLSGLILKSVINATNDKSPETRLQLAQFPSDGPRKWVSTAEAERWLSSRRNPKYHKTVSSESLTKPEEIDEPGLDLSGGYNFIPFARDETEFRPGNCRTSSGDFIIGKKGEEEHFTDYFEALIELQHMAEPRWRRPNEKGHFGIVTGVGWKRVAVDELEDETADSGRDTVSALEFMEKVAKRGGI
jgi:hypothetical protein